MKYTALIIAALLLTGCGRVSRIEANITGHSVECVGGVNYIQFPSGATVMYNTDGTIKGCTDKQVSK